MDTLYLLCVMLVTERSDKGPKGPGVAYLRFTAREGGNRPCVGREPGGSRGVPPEAFPCGIGSSLA